MTDIKEIYSPFGKAVIDQVQLELNRHGDLKHLLQRLDEQAPDTLEEQHNVLRPVITRYGPLFFLTVAKSDWTREQVQKMKANVKAGLDTPVPGTNRQLGKNPPPPRTGRVLTPIPQAPPPRRVYPSDRKQIVQPRSPYSAPSKEGAHPHRRATDEPVAPAATMPQARKLIDVPTYRGPDRRVLRDRRKGPTDRRAKLDVVYKNQRFGGRDRRKTVRRASDREKFGGGSS
jgi:hypothetical protein